MTLHSASAATGNPDLLRKLYEREGLRTLRSDTLARLAGALGVTLDELARVLELTDAPLAAPDRDGVDGVDGDFGLPVRFACQAGAWLEIDDAVQATAPTAPILADPAWPLPQWCEVVRGDSVNKLAADGALVQVVDWAALPSALPRTGQLVVLERVRHQAGLRERTVKVVSADKSGVRFWPASTNPRWSAPIELSPHTEGGHDDDTEVALRGLVIWVHARAPGA